MSSPPLSLSLSLLTTSLSLKTLPLSLFHSLSLLHAHILFLTHSPSLPFLSLHTHTHTHSASLFHSLTHPFFYSPTPMWNLEFLDHVGFSQWSQYPDEEFNIADDSKWEVRNLSSIAILYCLFVLTFLLLLSILQNRNFM